MTLGMLFPLCNCFSVVSVVQILQVASTILLNLLCNGHQYEVSISFATPTLVMSALHIGT